MNECFEEGMTLLFAFIGWILTAVGWFVTSAQANLREYRRDLRTQIDSLIESIEQAQELAKDYYSNKGKIRDKSRLKLFPIFEKIETKTSILKKYVSSFDADIAFSAFFEAITDEDFDSVDLPALEVNNERFTRISSSGFAFIKTIENWYISSAK